MWRRVLAGILGALAALAGVIACGYASMASDDFRNPNVSFWAAILGTGLMWLLTLGAFGMGIHFLKYCVTGRFFRVNLRARALILGALSFFPGFIVSAVPATLLVSKWRPRDIQADNVAMLASVFVGAALAVVEKGPPRPRASRRLPYAAGGLIFIFSTSHPFTFTGPASPRA